MVCAGSVNAVVPVCVAGAGNAVCGASGKRGGVRQRQSRSRQIAEGIQVEAGVV